MLNFIKRYWLIIISILYLLSPADGIPDFLLPAGLIDDGLLLIFAVLREIYLALRPKKEKS